MSSVRNDADLVSGRTRLLGLLIRRLYHLRFRPGEGPVYAGRPYVEDIKKVDCIITAHVMFPGRCSPFAFWKNGAHISVSQQGNALSIVAKKSISPRLWDDLRLLNYGGQFIVGYLYTYLPAINRNLLEQRYADGHLLNRTFSMFDLFGVRIHKQNKAISISWPPSFSPFPGSATLAPGIDEIYVRDYIDACNSDFRNDYDDCVRRIITSSEGFIRAQGWTTKRESFLERFRRFLRRRKRPNPNSLRRIFAHNLRTDIWSGHVINENMQYIYTVRNRIVHDGFRMSTSSAMFCSKSIGTLTYLLSWYSRNRLVAQFIRSLHIQFMAQSNVSGEYNDLDWISMNLRRRTDQPPIDSWEGFNDAMFSALRFNQKDQSAI